MELVDEGADPASLLLMVVGADDGVTSTVD